MVYIHNLVGMPLGCGTLSSSLGSSGKFERRNISPGRYSLRVIARDPDTRDRAVLRGYFVIPRVTQSTRDLPCTATVINTSSEKMGSRVEVEFRGSAAARSFQCRLDQGDNQPCELT